MRNVKKKKAVAVRYDSGRDRAPRVVAKGRGIVAENIIAVAEKNRVPLHADASLVQLLEALEVETEIPPELYRAVAEILVFMYRLKGTL
jgi:flagellar biosynthesis protein